MNSMKDNKYIQYLLIFCLFAIVIQVFFYKVTFLGENFYWRDLISHSYPAKMMFIDAIKQGYYPLWNPYVSLGIPYLADLSNQPMYIFNLLFIPLSGAAAVNLDILIHYFLCAVFTFLLVKKLTNNTLISVFGGISYPLCGYCVSLHSNLEYLSAISWIPATFWAAFNAKDTGKLLYTALTGFFMAMLIFCGEPMAFYYMTGFLILLAFVDSANLKELKSKGLIIIICLISSILLSLAQILPAFELTELSIRAGGLSFKEATIWSFNPARILEFYLPFFYGYNMPFPSYWGVFLQKINFSVPWAEGIYPGCIAFILALAGFIKHFNRTKLFWGLLALISLIFAAGRFTPAYELFFNNIPMFSGFRYPEKLIIFTSLGIIILACLSLKDLINSNNLFSKHTKYYIIFFVVTSLIISNLDFASMLPLKYMKLSGNIDTEFINSNFRHLILYFTSFIMILTILSYLINSGRLKSTVFMILLIVITFTDLFISNDKAFITINEDLFSHKTNTFRVMFENWTNKFPPRVYMSPYLTFIIPQKEAATDLATFKKNFYKAFNISLLENIIPNRHILYRINSLISVSGLQLRQNENIMDTLYTHKKAEYVEKLGINYAIATPNDRNAFLPFSEILDINTYNVILKPKNTPPRAFLVYNAIYCPNKEFLVNYFTNDTFAIRDAILLTGDKQTESYNKDINDSAIITDYNLNKITIKTKSKNDAYLLLLESYYPGWEVYIDGIKSTIIQADQIYRAVKLPKGNHIVVFSFEPVSVKLGIILNILFAILIIITIIKFKQIKI